jgi:dTDP-4-dehydrorhamnose 3,5-epimerase
VRDLRYDSAPVPSEIADLPLAGLRLIEPEVFRDARGYFFELHHEARFATLGLTEPLVQDNVSFSRRNVLRGLHFQSPGWQGKLVAVLRGEVFDVAVDLRGDSPTFGQWHGVTLSEANRLQLWVPRGFAHGFCVLSEDALVLYKCSAYYDPAQEHTLLWNDPDLAIDWPVRDPVLSDKDARGRRLRELPLARRGGA